VPNSATFPLHTGGLSNVPSQGASWPTESGNQAFDGRIQLWTTRRRRAQELKQLHEPQWITAWNSYRNTVEALDDPADWWRSNESIPTVFKIIETLLPRLVTGMFDSPDWFFVEARNGRSEIYETMCYNLLRQVVEEMDIFPKIYQAMRYSLIMGHCWGKVIWREEYQNRQVQQPVQLTLREALQSQFDSDATNFAEEQFGSEVLDGPSGIEGLETAVIQEEVFNGPDFEWRPLDRIFPDPSGRGRWFIEEIQTTLDELQQTQDDLDGIYDQTALNALKAHLALRKTYGQTGGVDHIGDARSGTSAGVSMEYQREPETTENIPEWIITPMREGGGVTLWQCWGWVQPEFRGPDGVEWRLLVIADGKYVLRDDPSPTPNGRPPYFPIKSIDIPNRLYGETIISYINPLVEQQSRLANMRLDEVYLGVFQQYLFRKNAVHDNSMLMQPGGAIEVNTEIGQSISDTFQVLPRTHLLPDVWNEDQWRQQQAEHTAAATDLMQGLGGDSRSTATEIERKLQQGNARHVLQIMYNDYTVKRELLKRTWGWLQSNMTQEKFVRLQGEEYAQVDWRSLQDPIDINVAGGLFALSKQNRIQMDQELIQFLTNDQLAQNFKIIPVLRKWMQDRGWKNPDNYLKTEEELAQEQYQDGQNQANAQISMAQMQAQLQAQGSSNGAGGASNGTGDAPPEEMSDVSQAGEQASMVGETLN